MGSPDIDSELYESVDILKIHGVNEFIAEISRKAKDEVENEGSNCQSADATMPLWRMRVRHISCSTCTFALQLVDRVQRRDAW